MKIVLAEVPYTKDRDISVEKSCVPEGAELTMAVFDEHAENNDAFYAEIKDADIIIDGYVHFGKKEIDAMDHCKVISFQSTGYNEADLDYAKEKGIAVCSILDYCTQETAESAMALMLNLQRGIRQYDRSVQQDHVWDYQVVPHLKRIAGQVMGIAGLGRIGQSVARKAQAFDMEVIAYDPFLPPAIAENLGVKLVDFDTLLAESDVLSLHMNLTEENYHMFNKEAFMKCKKHPIIVNEGRGPLICDEDLVWALDNGYIRGAALDMVESEDPDLDTCPLVGRDDVLLTPHSAWWITIMSAFRWWNTAPLPPPRSSPLRPACGRSTMTWWDSSPSTDPMPSPWSSSFSPPIAPPPLPWRKRGEYCCWPRSSRACRYSAIRRCRSNRRWWATARPKRSR